MRKSRQYETPTIVYLFLAIFYATLTVVGIFLSDIVMSPNISLIAFFVGLGLLWMNVNHKTLNWRNTLATGFLLGIGLHPMAVMLLILFFVQRFF